MTIYSSRVGVSGLCWGARGQSNHAFPCLEGFPENACRRYDAPAFFASGLCLAATILLVSQNMHQSIPAVPLIWILLSQAPGITILFAKKMVNSWEGRITPLFGLYAYIWERAAGQGFGFSVLFFGNPGGYWGGKMGSCSVLWKFRGQGKPLFSVQNFHETLIWCFI